MLVVVGVDFVVGVVFVGMVVVVCVGVVGGECDVVFVILFV